VGGKVHNFSTCAIHARNVKRKKNRYVGAEKRGDVVRKDLQYRNTKEVDRGDKWISLRHGMGNTREQCKEQVYMLSDRSVQSEVK
jgi:hypothetical protein